ncbi:bifunctional 4-hydroxy-2-oxoglutarate aldolase/2-dehydro-3-deoxy-phosphogluconate aldolase [Arthrobacter pigmenti]
MAALNEWFDNAFDQCPVMAILRGFSPDKTVELSETAWDLGITSVEVPIETPAAIDSLAAAVTAGRKRGHQVGAGTVVSIEQVQQAEANGAAFTVAPGLDAAVAQASIDAGLPHLPGVATPTEIQRARQLGLSWVKAFPATALGTAWFKAMPGPFPGLKIVATGGMNATNAAEYLEAGARVVAVGSALEDPSQLERLASLIGRSH